MVLPAGGGLWLDIAGGWALNALMRRSLLWSIVAFLLVPAPLWAVEAAPALTDREIVERLTRLEAGQEGLRDAVQHLREDLGQLRVEMSQLRVEMSQLRVDMAAQFARQFQLTLALLGAFAALVAAIIGFALWDRRTMLRPFEQTVQSLQAAIGGNRGRLAALLAALRALGWRDPEVAGVLREFHLL